MLTKPGAKLLGSGLPKLKQETHASSTLSALPTQREVTAQATILGTLQYMVRNSRGLPAAGHAYCWARNE